MAQIGNGTGGMAQVLFGRDGVKPSGTCNFSVNVEDGTAAKRPITTIAMGTPKSPNARRTCQI